MNKKEEKMIDCLQFLDWLGVDVLSFLIISPFLALATRLGQSKYLEGSAKWCLFLAFICFVF